MSAGATRLRPRVPEQLDDAAREVAILVVARAWGADFEWWVHGMLARRHGVPEEAIDAQQKPLLSEERLLRDPRKLSLGQPAPTRRDER